MGDRMLFTVPSTTVGKNMMHRPTANGRSMGNMSIASALATSAMSPHSGIICS